METLNSLVSQAREAEKRDDFKKAIQLYQTIIQQDANNPVHYNAYAVILYRIGRFKDAASLFEKAITIDAEYAEAYSNLGALHAKFKDFKKAIALYQKAIAIKPQYAGSYTNLGNALNKIHEYEQAVYFHLKAISIDPKSANHYSNLASAYKNLGRFNKAQSLYTKTLSMHPSHVNAHFDLATVLLQTDQFEQGFREYEWRLRKDEMQGHIKKYEAIFSQPRWNGESLEGKTILVHAEQGFGDSLMVMRYFKMLKAQGATTIAFTRPELVQLYQHIEAIDEVLDREHAALPQFDYQLPIMSLPLMCDPHLDEVNANYPYISVEGVKADKQKLQVGIVWGASNTGESYAKKVFDLSYFKPLIEHDEVDVHSLQIGEDAKQIQTLHLEDAIIDNTSTITNFYDTAKMMKELDLIITADTSVAHLAGGMGINVWILLQKVPDWRYGVEGEQSLWYPSATLIRQHSLGDWESVFRQMHHKLTKIYGIKVRT